MNSYQQQVPADQPAEVQIDVDRGNNNGPMIDRDRNNNPDRPLLKKLRHVDRPAP
jgi:hypothetical protein